MSAARPIHDHGTYETYQWHVKQKVPTCAPCRDAAAAHMRQFRSASPRTRIRDSLQKTAYHAALMRLREAHRDEFDAYYGDERVRAGL